LQSYDLKNVTPDRIFTTVLGVRASVIPILIMVIKFQSIHLMLNGVLARTNLLSKDQSDEMATSGNTMSRW